MELNKTDITQGYQPVPEEDRIWNLPSGDDDCELCNGSGDVQCCRGEYYYTDTCDCVLIQYWENVGNEHMANGYREIYDNIIRLRNM